MNNPIELSLERLKEGLPGVTPAFGGVLYETCLICLHHQHHASGVELKLQGMANQACRIVWDTSTNDQMRRTWNDLHETTELAATGIAFLLVLALTNYTVAQRSQRGTGFDYWLADKKVDDLFPFNYTAKLEISGILKAQSEPVITARVHQKREQAGSSKSLLPVYVIVVEFSRPLAYVVNQ